MAAVWTSLGTRSAKGVMAATEAAPTLSTEGATLEDVQGITVTAEAAGGQTFNADVGQVDVYVYDPVFNAWAPAPSLVLPVPPGSSGQQRIVLGTLTVDNPRGRVAMIANGLSVTGGSVTVYIAATLLSRNSPVPA